MTQESSSIYGKLLARMQNLGILQMSPFGGGKRKYMRFHYFKLNERFFYSCEDRDSKWRETSTEPCGSAPSHFELRFRNKTFVESYGIWMVSQNHLWDAFSSCSRKSYFITKCMTTNFMTRDACPLPGLWKIRSAVSSGIRFLSTNIWLTRLSNHIPRSESLERHQKV